eukprot:3187947-Rhodomonas_salina.1
MERIGKDGTVRAQRYHFVTPLAKRVEQTFARIEQTSLNILALRHRRKSEDVGLTRQEIPNDKSSLDGYDVKTISTQIQTEFAEDPGRRRNDAANCVPVPPVLLLRLLFRVCDAVCSATFTIPHGTATQQRTTIRFQLSSSSPPKARHFIPSNPAL